MSSFVPQFSLISSITLGQQTVVTFTASCDFTVGEIVSFRVSPPSGTKELNNQQAIVLAVSTVTNPNDTITVPIVSTHYTPFIYETENAIAFPSMVVPAGSGIIPNSIPTQTSLLDVFDNVPNV